jgi:2-oxoglutarate ferredoxin oxidoreductase subunit beta
MQDGSVVRFRKLAAENDPTNRDAAYAQIRASQTRGEIVTGLLYIDESAEEMHGVSGTIDQPLVDVPYDQLCPGSSALAELMEEYR